MPRLQEGMATFSYGLKPHLGFDPLQAVRFGMENRYPLVVIPASEQPKTKNEKPTALNLDPESFSSLILFSLKPTSNQGEFLACLYNASEKDVVVDLDQTKKGFYKTDIDGLIKSESIEALKFHPKAIRFLLVVNK